MLPCRFPFYILGTLSTKFTIFNDIIGLPSYYVEASYTIPWIFIYLSLRNFFYHSCDFISGISHIPVFPQYCHLEYFILLPCQRTRNDYFYPFTISTPRHYVLLREFGIVLLTKRFTNTYAILFPEREFSLPLLIWILILLFLKMSIIISI